MACERWANEAVDNGIFWLDRDADLVSGDFRFFGAQQWISSLSSFAPHP